MEYLAFIDDIGRGQNDEYIYRFDYTENPDLTWGDFFNIVPCNIVPNLQPEENNISRSEKVISINPLTLAKHNGCFSMQDCIDGVISMAFSDTEKVVYDGDVPVNFKFGMTIDSVHELLERCSDNFNSIEMISNKEDDGESIIDDLIEQLNKNGE